MKSNFDFLNRYWPALAQIGATAETYVYSDPNACIYKLGMFAERLVQESLVFEHIAEPAVDNTHANRIRILKRAGLLPHEIDNTLYVLRKTRNSAVHIGTDSVDEAKTLLSLTYNLAVWFMETYLIPELLSMVDDGKIAFNPAVELSYLDSYQQRAVLDAMALNDCTPSHAQSIRLKKLAQEGLLDDQIVYAVLAETKPNQQEQLKFKREELRKYFPSGYTEEQMRRDIIKGLELLKRQRERNRDAR